MESYILTRTMHFGHLKESFGRGTIITFEPQTRQLTIDGRHFEDYRDLDVLKRQSTKNPENPWIIPYTEEALQDVRQDATRPDPAVPKHESNDMEIVRDDADTHETIDISHTKVSDRNRQEQEARSTKAATEDLPVVQGYESVEDRIARLKEKPATDMSARAERVRLMRERKAEMPIERDDSLGRSGSAAEALNAGVPVSGRRAEETDNTVLEQAAQRKKEAESRRQQVAMEQEGLDADQAGIDEVTPKPEAPAGQSGQDESTEASDVTKMQARIAELEGQLAEQSNTESSTEQTLRKTTKVPVTD